MNFFLKTYYLLKHIGPGLLGQRLGLAVKNRLGMNRQVFRRRPWSSIDLSEICEAGVPTDDSGYSSLKQGQSLPYFFPLGQLPKISGHVIEGVGDRSPSLQERLALLREDRCVYFFHTPSPDKNNWHRNPFTGGISPSDRVWSELPFFDDSLGDARVMWEPSRAAWVYDLVRAAARDGDKQAHAAEYWRWVDSWMDENQPFDGCQWMCGQESAVRFMAMILGFWAFEGESAPHRWGQIAKLAWATGYRIEHHIDYAISQRNNHALSEACGLMLIGYLFPEFQASSRWRQVGRRVMTQQLRLQIYDDGSYIQHSFNYHRVMLQVSMIALRVAELAGEPFDRDIYIRLGKANAFLYAHLDEQSGRAPNYGNNDGAMVLPLSECDFTDYRPVLQAVHFLVHRERLLPAGIWDEDLNWIFGDDANALSVLPSPQERVPSTAFETGGYYTLRNKSSWAMMRCHEFRDRPAHSDQLHLDLWWQGCNVLQDAGTYLYFVPGREDVEQYFKSTKAHNTIEIDGCEPAEFVSRFLMLPWLSGKMRCHHANGETPSWMVGERYDYDRKPWGVMHRRCVISLTESLWIVVDDLFGSGTHRATLRWHLSDWPWELDTTAGKVTAESAMGAASLAVCARENQDVSYGLESGRDVIGDVQGYVSPYYGVKRAAPTFEVAYEFIDKSRVVSAVQLGGAKLELTQNNQDNKDVLTNGETWSIIMGETLKLVKLATLGRDLSEVFVRVE